MPSITYWSRLEPRPRSPSISGSLSARIRDPLWLLTRQWQFGEFQGEDAGSPAYVEFSTRISPITSWRANGGRTEQIPPGVPLEALVASEPFTPDFAMRVELGQTFERLLAAAFAEAAAPENLVRTFRAAYPLPSSPELVLVTLLASVDLALQADLAGTVEIPDSLRSALRDKGLVISEHATVAVDVQDSQWSITDDQTEKIYAVKVEADRLDVYLAAVSDHETVRFLTVCAGRAVDGVSLHDAASRSLPLLPTPLVVDPVDEQRVIAALENFTSWVRDVFGQLGETDPPAWDSERLEYGVEVIASIAAGGEAVLAASPDKDGGYEWYSFDFRSSHAGSGQPSQPASRSVLPIHVRFRGMPNSRWWDFETAVMDFGNLQPDRRDVAKLVVADFMLVHGNDWFVLPLNQPVGSLCHVDSLLVHDVFGGLTLVERADVQSEAEGQQWTMFSTTIEGETDRRAHFLLIPPSAVSAARNGPTLEEVRFFRDEIANLVWAVEHTTEDGVGQPRLGYERDMASRREPLLPDRVEGPERRRSAPLRYQLQTSVPVNWIPFLPAAIDSPRGVIALERGVMLRPIPGIAPQTITPLARILRAPSAGESPYRIREEEVPRSGIRISRVVRHSRWTDGSTHLWIARTRSAGAGEGSSGLRFDLARPTKPAG